jgi:hypothetical protein
MKGAVTNIYLSDDGLVYTLLNAHGPMVYVLNASSGSVVWATRVSLEGNTSSMIIAGASAYLASCTYEENESIIDVYMESGREFKPLYSQSIESPLYKILAVQPTPTGDVVVGGARYKAGRGYQYYAGLLSRRGMVWEDFWGGAADEYFNLISVGPDSSICLAGPPGGLACYDYTGDTLYKGNITFKPLAILNLGSGRVVVGGVSNSTGVLYAKTPEGAWLKRTGAFITTTLASGGNDSIYAIGVIAPSPYRLAVLALSLNGTPLLLGVSNETYNDILPLAASARGNLVIVGGSINSKPFVESLLILRSTPSTRATTTAFSGKGGSRLILVEEAALVASAVLLAVSLAVFKPWRWRRGGGA